MHIKGKRRPWQPKMTGKTLKERPSWNLNEVDPCDRDVWRSSMRSAMHAASLSYLEKSQLVWIMLLHLNVNLNADDDDEEL